MGVGMRVAILGPPASGKGTQAGRLAESWGVPHVSTGDLLRDAVAAGTRLGRQAAPYMERGDLVPDELVLEIVSEELRGDGGFVLDGFPRTRAQYDELEVPLDGVVVLEVPQQESVRRITGRRVCPEGHVYHLEHDPPAEPGACDVDGRGLVQREDDRQEVVENRWQEYRDQTVPLIDHLEGHSVPVTRVDGVGTPDEVAERVVAAVS